MDIEYRGYLIVGDGTYGMKFVKSKGRGSAPKELRGSYTGVATARAAIDIILFKKGNKDGKNIIDS